MNPKVGSVLRFKPNTIPYLHDGHLCSKTGIPEGVRFTIRDCSRQDYVELIGDGYGAYTNPGKGSILVHKDFIR